ncbi:hypothetical protein [Methylocystis suflitae]|uniref:hypothetical protein n=1 Tax=Methylocystis suflitae TaxID=2951405 RepID=UPI002109CADE|nr:hypothetical protein [Methylocystis suflitae]MCQ4189420.1 hypothetical protein [Methylocystis suflitae]
MRVYLLLLPEKAAIEPSTLPAFVGFFLRGKTRNVGTFEGFGLDAVRGAVHPGNAHKLVSPSLTDGFRSIERETIFL